MGTMFRDYMVGRIPDDWTIDRIAGLLSEEFSGTWGPENVNGVSVLRSTNFQNSGYLNLDSVAVREIPENHLSNKAINIGDILLERSGGGPQQPVGRVSWCDDRVTGWTFSNFCQILRSSAGVDSKFLFYALYYLHMSSITLTYQNQTTGIRNLEYKSYLRISIPLPPLPEQRKIAEILSTVDENIEKTDAIIQETQQLKKGLMQKFFTEGIGHTRFKETKIGRIPEEWEVVPVGQIAKDTLLGTNQTSNARTGIPLMKMGNVTRGQFVFDRVEYVDKETAVSLQGFVLRDGDFLFNTRNTPELVGKSAVWKAKYGYALYNNNLLRIGFKKNIIHSTDYVSFWMNSHRGLSQLRRLVSGTTSVAAIYWKELRKYPVPVTSLEEQERITKILLEVDSKSEAETTYKLELEQLKKGLMQVLLTGKIRVKV